MKKAIKSTLQQVTSLCPTCYKTIPATLYESEGRVYMEKTCLEHGPTTALVEPSVEVFRLATGLSNRHPDHAHLVLDVTHRCNHACHHCYYPVNNQSKDPSIEELVQTAQTVNLDLILGGAEPTTRKDLPRLVHELSRLRSVSMITNGLALANDDLVQDLATCGLVQTHLGFSVFEAAISLHTKAYSGPSAYRTKLAVIENITSSGLRLAELMFTIRSLDDLPEVLGAIQQHAPYTRRFRVRVPHNTWETYPGHAPLFLSGLLRRFSLLARREQVSFGILEGWDNNLYHLNVAYNGIPIRLIACPDKYNVILGELLGYGPFHRSQSGELTNFIHSLIINQGMRQGWLHGRRIQPL